MIYVPPKRATYQPAGSSLAYPVLVHEVKARYGQTDYRIATPEHPEMCQWIRPTEKIKLTFTEEAP